MKKHLSLSTSLLSLTSTLLSAQDTGGNSSTVEDKALIVYLSRTNNTQVIAEIIQENIGGRLEELTLETPYPQDYDAIVEQVDQQNENGTLPALSTEINNMNDYNTLFLGFPTWDMDLPPPMKSFLNEYDLSGKTVVPFNTNGGYGTGSSFQTLEALCNGCNILEGFEIKGGLERDGILLAIEGQKKDEAEAEVIDWLNAIGFSGHE